ncbi:hypothetical protein [uncultured Robinsoniella sp.]|uniref:hypothetical protein n=1 Tax=uncultured Robinsoniella sp. TaxID=904190 RepID=UPI002911E6AE|nr:hypothetical protein [Clostridiales bacterium]
MRRQQERMPSEIISDFVDLLNKSHPEYLESMKIANKFDDKILTWVHDMEKETNYDVRNKLITRWHRERMERRKHKDNAVLYEKIHRFSSNEKNKVVLKNLRGLLSDQIKTEEYLQNPNREYKHRVGDDDV